MCAAQNLFDPELYRDVRLPFEQARSMPPWCYTSTEFFNREVDRIFRRVWNFAGRADEVPKPGDYFTLDMFGESIIIVRGRDHVVRGLRQYLPPPRYPPAQGARKLPRNLVPLP